MWCTPLRAFRFLLFPNPHEIGAFLHCVRRVLPFPTPSIPRRGLAAPVAASAADRDRVLLPLARPSEVDHRLRLAEIPAAPVVRMVNDRKRTRNGKMSRFLNFLGNDRNARFEVLHRLALAVVLAAALAAIALIYLIN